MDHLRGHRSFSVGGDRTQPSVVTRVEFMAVKDTTKGP